MCLHSQQSVESIVHVTHVNDVKRNFDVWCHIKAPVLQILLENHELCKYAKISLHIHIIVDLNKKYRFKPTYVHCFA